MDMLGVFAEFETNLRSERQMEGVRIAKEQNKFKGRQSSIDRDQVLKLKNEGKGASAIAKEMNIDRTSVYRILKEVK